MQNRQYRHDKDEKLKQGTIPLSLEQQKMLEEEMKRGILMSLHSKALLSDGHLNYLLNKNMSDMKR